MNPNKAELNVEGVRDGTVLSQDSENYKGILAVSVRMPHFTAGGLSFNTWPGDKIPQVTWYCQKRDSQNYE